MRGGGGVIFIYIHYSKFQWLMLTSLHLPTEIPLPVTLLHYSVVSAHWHATVSFFLKKAAEF